MNLSKSSSRINSSASEAGRFSLSQISEEGTACGVEGGGKHQTMKLSKNTFYAAAVATALFFGLSLPAQAEAYKENDYNFNDYQNNTIEISKTDTYGPFRGSGTLIVNATDVVRIDGTLIYYYALTQTNPSTGNYVFAEGRIIVSTGGGYAFIFDDDYDMTPQQTVESYLSSWSGGELIIEGGEVVLAGSICAWYDFGTALNSRYGIDTSGTMYGVQKITITNGSTLDVSYNEQSLTGTRGMVEGSSNIFVFLNNLNTGDNPETEAGALTTLYIGYSSNYHIDIHIDGETLDGGGSIGQIIGSASVYKTGEGDFTFLRDNVDFTGDIYAAGGRLILNCSVESKSSNDDPTGVLAIYGYDLEYGHALANASSVNIAGTVDETTLTNGSTVSSLSEASRAGVDVRFVTENTNIQYYDEDTGEYHYYTTVKNSFFPTASAGMLVIEQNQIIKNFQAMFAVGASATDATLSAASAVRNAADSASTDSPLIPGTGAGSYLIIAEDATLAVYQEAGHGGIYKGTICGGVDENGDLITGGTLVKYGAGDLALILEGSDYKKLVILEGRLITNVETINLDPGCYDWETGEWVEEPGVVGYGDATFVIVQNWSNTLDTRLEFSGVLEFANYCEVNTLGGPVDASNDFRATGTITITNEQRFVTGDVVVYGGMKLILTATELYEGDINSWVVYDKDGNPIGEDGIEFSGGTFALANSFIMYGEDEDIRAQLEFGNTNQKVNNLTGDLYSQVDLGRSTLTSNITLTGYETYTGKQLQYGTFEGEISGIGNIIKTGSGTMTVGAGIVFFGVLAVAEGDYVVTSSTGHDRYVSALILNSGTTATLAGNSAVAALYGAKDATISVGGTLTVGNSASRMEMLSSAAGSDGTLVANSISNSSEHINTNDINADTWLRSITDFVGKTKEWTYTPVDEKGDPVIDGDGNPVTETVTVELLSETQSAAISRYMSRECTSDDWSTLSELFGCELTNTGTTADYTQLTEGDFARLYVRLLAEDSFGALTCDSQGNVTLGANYAEMVDRLSFDGALTADTIEKIDSSRLTLSGSVKANFIQIKAGTLELDYDALLDQQLEAVEPDDVEPLADTERVVVVEGKVTDGIVIEDGATLSFNTTGAGEGAEITLNESISGKGDFEKTGEGKLILGENVLYTGSTTVTEGDLEMALRAEQGDVTVVSDIGTLTLVQAEDVTYTGAISDAGNLVKEGAGALTLAGEIEIGADVVVAEGKLTLVDYVVASEAPSGSASDQTIYIAEDATFATDLTERGDRLASTSYAEILGEGTFEKDGEGTLILAYSNDDEEAEKFTGTFVVNAGTLTLAAANIAPEASADVAAGATLNIVADQELVGITGEGAVTIQSEATLTLSLAGNEDYLSIDSSSGMYEMKTSENDEHSFVTFSGKISGTGTLLLNTDGVFSLDASSVDGVGLSVSSGKLIIDSSLFYNPNAPLAVTIAGDGKASEVVLKVDGEEEITFYGSIETAPDSDQETTTVNLGKYGTGTLSVTSDYTAGANLNVYQGTLKISGTDSQVFGFESATIALDATIEFNYTGDRINLSNIEGSGTIRLCYDVEAKGGRGNLLLNSDSMKAPTAKLSSDGTYFNGILEVDGINLVIIAGTDGMDVCSLASSDDASIAVFGTLTIYQEQNTVVAGTFNAGDVTVTGAGRLAISSIDAIANFTVSDGNLQVDALAKLVDTGSDDDAKGTIYVSGRSKLYFSSASLGYSTKVDSISAAQIDSSGTVNSLGLYKTGETDMEISFADATDGGQSALSLSDGLWNSLASSSRTLVLGVEEGKLIVSGLADLDARVNIETLEGGTIVIKAETDAEILDRNITGDGDFEKTGSRSLTVTTTQGYTGTTTISNGSVTYESGVRLYTSELIIKSGTSMNSGVTLVNGSFTLEQDASATLDVTKGESISYAGELTVEGTIYLTGSGAMTLGKEMAIFDCTNPDAEWFTDEELRELGSHLDNNWSSLMISQTSAGSVSAYAIPESFSDISGVDLRDGLSGSFTRALDRLAGLDKIENGVILESDVSEIGLALLTSPASSLSETIANLSPISYSYMTAVVANTFRDDIDQISKRITQRHYDAASDVVDNGVEYFVSARSNIVTNSHSNDSANYDYDTYGVFAGLDQKLDDISLIGIAVSYDHGKADIHDGGGKIESDTFRATLFGGTLFGSDYSFFFNAGASFHYGSYDVKRKTICGTAKGDADGFGGGVFGEVGKGFLLYADSASGNRVLFTARTGLSALYTRINDFDEDGVAGLDTDAFDAFNLRWTIGGDLDYIFPVGEWSMRIGISAGYAHEFVDDDVSIDSQFKAGGGKFSVDAVMFAENSIYAGPTFTVEVSEHTALFLGYYVEYGTNDFFDQNINLGFRHCF